MNKLATATLGWVLDNPVVTKELRGRMRGSRAYWMLLGYLLLLAIAMLIAYYAWRASSAAGGGTPASFAAGRNFFNVLFYVQATLVSLITPALTSGALSIEREQRTFEMMRCTTLRPSAIVLGKLASSISFIALLLICSLPLVSICFLLGGVAPDEVVAAYAMLICDGLLFGAIGIAWSTCAANTAASTALSYLSLFAYFLLTVTFSFAAQLPRGAGTLPLTALNPIGAVTCVSYTERYFHFTLSAWVAGVLVNGSLTLLLSAISINRLEDYPWRRVVWVRIATFLFVGILMFFIMGAIVAMPLPGSGAPFPAVLVAFVGLFGLLIFLPPLATVDLPTEAEHGIAAKPPTLNPITAFREASTRTAATISLLLAAMVLVEALIAGRSGGWPAAAMAKALGHVHLTQAATALYLSFAFGVVGLATLLSVVLRNRWGAMALVYIVTGVAWFVPWIAYGFLTSYTMDANVNRGALNWLYVSPLAALTALADDGTLVAYSMLRFAGMASPWVVTSILYAGVGAGCFGLGTYLRLRRNGEARSAD
jgi:ABC-type transport system involved in multi-copper enzyme maturation permease subunit